MTKELEDWWGIDDLLEDNADAAEAMVADLTKILIYRIARGRW